jgi:fructose-1,6-bisphosphatase/inositol monophosphatase family enzyme
MSISQTDKDRVEKLVREAGAILLKYWPQKLYGTSQPELTIEQKKDGTLVTQADLESNQLLVAGLQKFFPDDAMYSEELGGTCPVEKRAWIIDPLDGTKSFIQGNDDFSVLVGLCQRQRAQFGMMYFPARKLLAIGGAGQGAQLNQESLHVSSRTTAAPRSIYLRHLQLTPSIEYYDTWMDSGMAFLNLCRGIFDGIIIKLVHHQEWDLAAPTVMIEESGGRVTNEHGEPFVFRCAPVADQYFVASNGHIHEQLLSLIPKGD